MHYVAPEFCSLMYKVSTVVVSGLLIIARQLSSHLFYRSLLYSGHYPPFFFYNCTAIIDSSHSLMYNSFIIIHTVTDYGGHCRSIILGIL